ncbi:MAG TPA: glycosyltransferase family 2 protein [Candidatus Angelobacter sp.]
MNSSRPKSIGPEPGTSKGTSHIGHSPQEQNTHPAPLVSIIILSWKSYEVTRDCLLSLRNLAYPNFEVVLVDNNSADGSVEKLAPEFPEVRLIENKVNLGFPGGNNVAISEVLERGTDYLLLLNNDTVVTPDFLAKIVAVAESDDAIGITTPKIMYFEPRDRIWFAGGFYKPWWSFPKMRGVNRRDVGRFDQTQEISFATGCVLLIKAAVVRQIGLLDEAFFLGFEDMDWSLRALRAGYKLVYVGGAVVWHRASYATKKSAGKDLKDYYSARNSILFARKHMANRYWPLFVLSLARYLAYRTGGYLLRLEFNRVAALYRGIWDGFNFRTNRPQTGGAALSRGHTIPETSGRPDVGES